VQGLSHSQIVGITWSFSFQLPHNLIMAYDQVHALGCSPGVRDIPNMRTRKSCCLVLSPLLSEWVHPQALLIKIWKLNYLIIPKCELKDTYQTVEAIEFLGYAFLWVVASMVGNASWTPKEDFTFFQNKLDSLTFPLHPRLLGSLFLPPNCYFVLREGLDPTSVVKVIFP